MDDAPEQQTDSAQAGYNPLIAFGVIFAMAVLVIGMGVNLRGTSKEVVVVTQHATTTPESLFEKLQLDATAVYVADLSQGEVLYQKNSEAQLPLASLTKIMTGLVAERVFSEHEVIALEREALLEEGEQGFSLGQKWELRNLLDVTVVASSNDAAAAIAAAFDRKQGIGGGFVEIMNQTAEALGLSQTYFLNPTGLDIHDDTYATAYGSARDVARLVVHTLEKAPSVLRATGADSITRRAIDGSEITVENTNEGYQSIPWLVAGKTGYTDTAGGNLAVVFEAGIGRPIVAVVLGSSKEGRFEDMKKLAETTFELLATKN